MFFALVLYYAGAYIAETISGGQIILVLALGLMGIAVLSETGGKLSVRKCGILLYILTFLLFCVSSLLWAQSPQLGIPKINALIFIFAAMIVLYVCTYQMAGIEDLLKAIMYGGYIVVFYATVRYGFSGLLRLLQNDTRLTNELFNANTLGMCAAYSIIINFFFIIYEKLSIRDILIIPAFVLILVSQSRKAVLVMAIAVIGIYVLKNFSNKNFGVNLIKLVVGLAVIVLIFIAFSRLPVMQPIMKRLWELVEMVLGNGTRGKNSAWIRFAYTELGLKLFKEHPLVGIGIGNANLYTQMYYGHNHYLHNNYVELLACGGIIGFLIYYSIWIYLLGVFIVCRKQRSREYDICLILFIVRLILDYGAVWYYSKDTYFFLMLFWVLANKLLQERRTAVVSA